MNSLDEYRPLLPVYLASTNLHRGAPLSAFINFENRVTGIEILSFRST